MTMRVKLMGLAAMACAVALGGCSMSQAQIKAEQYKALGIKEASTVERFCAMSEHKRLAFILDTLRMENASGGYIGGRHYDTTVVLDRELSARRYAWREVTGC